MIFVDGSSPQKNWLRRKNVEIVSRNSMESLRDWVQDNPVVQPFANDSLFPLLDLKFSKCWALKGGEITPVSSWSDLSPGIAELRVDAGKVLLFGFKPDRESTNWPLRPSFAPFLHHAVVALEESASAPKSWSVGESIPLSGAGKWSSVDSAVPSLEQDVDGVVKPMAPGIYSFLKGSEKELFAVNTPPEESDLEPWKEGQPWLDMVSPRSKPGEAAGRKPLTAEESERQSPLWWWLLAVALLALIAEMALANRTSA